MLWIVGIGFFGGGFSIGFGVSWWISHRLFVQELEVLESKVMTRKFPDPYPSEEDSFDREIL